MSKVKYILLGAALLISTATLTGTAQAGVVTGGGSAGSPGFVGVFKTTDNSKDIALSPGTPTFNANLATWSTFNAPLHDILGVGFAYPTDADVEFQDATGPDGIHGDITLPYAMVGRQADGKSGWFIWKFQMASGYQTGAGAKIDASVYFRHDPTTSHGLNARLVVADSITVFSDFSGLSASHNLATRTAQDIFAPGTGFATYTGPTSLAIPAGLTSFYVFFTDDGSSARWALNSLSVNAAPVGVPEPASLSVLTATGLASLKRRRR